VGDMMCEWYGVVFFVSNFNSLYLVDAGLPASLLGLQKPNWQMAKYLKKLK